MGSQAQNNMERLKPVEVSPDNGANTHGASVVEENQSLSRIEYEEDGGAF